MADRSRTEIAGQYEATALECLSRAAEGGSVNRADVAAAQVGATLALCQRVADLTETINGTLGMLLGDGSHLDGLKVVVREGLGGVEDRLSKIQGRS